MAAPGEDLQLALVAVVWILAPRLGVRVGIEVVGAPHQHRQLMLARAGLGDDLLLLARQQLHLDADRRQVGLDRLRDIAIRCRRDVVHGDREAVGQPGLRQQLLRLRDVLAERVFLESTRQRVGQERLADAPGVRRDVLGDGLVVDRPLDRLMHLHLLQLRHRLVHRDIHRRALRRGRDRQVLVAGDRLELIGAEVARDVGVALLQLQKLHRRIGDMTQHHARNVAGFSAA